VRLEARIAQDRLHMDLDGCLSDIAPTTDHLVGVPFDKTIEDLDFSLGHRGSLRHMRLLRTCVRIAYLVCRRRQGRYLQHGNSQGTMATPVRVKLGSLAMCLQRSDLWPFRRPLLVAHHHYPNVPHYDQVQRAHQSIGRYEERNTAVDLRNRHVVEIGRRNIVEEEDDLAVRPPSPDDFRTLRGIVGGLCSQDNKLGPVGDD